MKFKWLLAALLGLLVAACAPNAALMSETGPRYTAEQSGPEDYKLGSGDKVRLTVFNEATLSGEFSVSSTGALSFPLIGDVAANNRTIQEITQETQKRLADGYLRDPKVNIEVVTYRPFFILGEVKSPGQYPYSTSMTVLNAIATAQGFSPRAERKVAYIRRAGAAQEESFRLTPDLRVSPGDTIRIGERYF
ncbi:polysaccharide biosynthesis/export family protein [Sphingobium aromaticiconvertens]|uniref:polysaccharide biosynthesis/export family protein n=1 Tax=Sphingobium aromaticiconvertens TaxID=365341 RepID=UPI0030196E40